MPDHNNAHFKHGRRDYRKHINLSIVPSWWLPSAGLTSQTCPTVKVWRDCTHPHTVLCFTRWCTHSVANTQRTGMWWLGSFMFKEKVRYIPLLHAISIRTHIGCHQSNGNWAGVFKIKYHLKQLIYISQFNNSSFLHHSSFSKVFFLVWVLIEMVHTGGEYALIHCWVERWTVFWRSRKRAGWHSGKMNLTICSRAEDTKENHSV